MMFTASAGINCFIILKLDAKLRTFGNSDLDRQSACDIGKMTMI
jgi:hypothetical protein